MLLTLDSEKWSFLGTFESFVHIILNALFSCMVKIFGRQTGDNSVVCIEILLAEKALVPHSIFVQ